MKNILTFILFVLSTNLFAQTNSDSLKQGPNLNSIMAQKSAQVELLSQAAFHLEETGNSYNTSEIMMILTGIVYSVGALTLPKNPEIGKVLIGGGVVLSISTLVRRYVGHDHLITAGKSLSNYSKSVK